MHVEAVISRAVSIASSRFQSAELRTRSEALSVIIKDANLDSQIRIVPELKSGTALKEQAALSPEIRRDIGERVLKLYFAMTCRGGPLFLDLRPKYFGWNDGFLEFAPLNLSIVPDTVFSERIADLYAGFYRYDEVRFERGLELYAWKCEPRAGYLERLRILLRKHFGAAERGTMRFQVDNFRTTFHSIFVAATEEKAKFHPDLAFLGAALVGVYLTLELLDSDVSPYSAYENATS
jgi:hypothetical protein